MLSLAVLCLIGSGLLGQDLPETRRKRKPDSDSNQQTKPIEQVNIFVGDNQSINIDSIFQAIELQIDNQPASTEAARAAQTTARNALMNARRRVEVRRYELESKNEQSNLLIEIHTSMGKALSDAAQELRLKADQATDAQAREILLSTAESIESSVQSYRALRQRKSTNVIVNIDDQAIDIRINKPQDEIKLPESNREQMIERGKGPDSTRRYKIVTTGLAGFNLGLNTWTHNGNFNLTGQLNDLELKQPNSVEYTLLLLPTRIRLGHRSKWHLLTSANLQFQNYKFQERLTLEPRTPEFVYRIDPDRPLDRNKLSMTYTQLPLQLMYASDRRKPREGFRIAAGPYVSYLLSAHTKQRELGKRKVRVRDDFNLDRFQYGIGGRIGYSWFELYANYGLSELFEAVPNSPNLRSFSLGIRII
jgi:hypothetical protein